MVAPALHGHTKLSSPAFVFLGLSREMEDEFFGALPDELLLLIFSHVPTVSLVVTISRVCMRWCILAQESMPLELDLRSGNEV